VDRAEAEARQPGQSRGTAEAGGRQAWHDGRAEAGARRAVRAGGGWGVRVSVCRAGGEHRAAGARVKSGAGERAGRGGTDLSRVRERGAGMHGIFL
jgi:hypothetical protein